MELYKGGCFVYITSCFKRQLFQDYCQNNYIIFVFMYFGNVTINNFDNIDDRRIYRKDSELGNVTKYLTWYIRSIFL